MIIQDVPAELQPPYKSIYPEYSAGLNLEEIYYQNFLKHKDSIQTERIYLPVFWTSYYVTQGYGENIQFSYNWLNTLDRSRKYFTVVQYASGIYVPQLNIDMLVFSAGGGGLNKKSECVRVEDYYGCRQHIFHGNKGDYDIPLMCLPIFPHTNVKKDIYCSFMGRLNTHECRFKMRDILKHNPKYMFYESQGYAKYNEIVNRSVFTLAPRGYGYTSFRIYEAIMAESIPIYIWQDKKVLPFEDTLDWSSFCIIVHSSEIDKLPTIMERIDVESYQKKLREVKSQFHFKETFQYIVGKL